MLARQLLYSRPVAQNDALTRVMFELNIIRQNLTLYKADIKIKYT